MRRYPCIHRSRRPSLRAWSSRTASPSWHPPARRAQAAVRWPPSNSLSVGCSSPCIFGDQRGRGARPGERAQGGGTRSGSPASGGRPSERASWPGPAAGGQAPRWRSGLRRNAGRPAMGKELPRLSLSKASPPDPLSLSSSSGDAAASPALPFLAAFSPPRGSGTAHPRACRIEWLGLAAARFQRLRSAMVAWRRFRRRCLRGRVRRRSQSVLSAAHLVAGAAVEDGPGRFGGHAPLSLPLLDLHASLVFSDGWPSGAAAAGAPARHGSSLATPPSPPSLAAFLLHAGAIAATDASCGARTGAREVGPMAGGWGIGGRRGHGRGRGHG
ncbi:unnamed protein product [Urochloa humidicola]